VVLTINDPTWFPFLYKFLQVAREGVKFSRRRAKIAKEQVFCEIRKEREIEG
jgi:hypothetical protein